MFWEYFNLSRFGWELPFHPDILSNIALGLLGGAVLIFGGYQLAGTKGALTLLLGGVIVFALMKGVLPI
jgi:hypothetical protein